MWTLVFWKQAGERAVKAGAASLLSLWVVADRALNVLTLDWTTGLGVGLGAAVVSVLLSVVSGALPVGDASSPSLVVTQGRHAA